MVRYAVRSLPAHLRAIDRVTSRRYKRDATACIADAREGTRRIAETYEELAQPLERAARD
jgi:hypothetical protein